MPPPNANFGPPTDAGGIQDFARFIPGGLFRCRWDEPLTLMEMSEGFLRLLGYTREEIAQRYGNSFRRMIDPRDWERSLQDVQRQMSFGTEKELEYRMQRKNGEIIWVLDKGNLVRSKDGTESFYCLLVDITSSKKVQEELRLSLERHEIILNQTNDIIVEWDIQEDHLSFSSNWRKKFGYEPLKEHVRRNLVYASHIHPDDVAAFAQMLEKLREGTPYCEVELRLTKTGGGYLWCRMRFTAQFDDSGQAIKAVGVIMDIDEEKRQAQKLIKMAQKDTLTGLYNKGTAQSLAAQALEAADCGSLSALMIIDIDNFKTVNDTMGHLFGDEFLVGISRELSSLFRERDIVGRIGGDEFLAFMQSIPNRSVALQRAEQILSIFHRESEKAGLQDKVSCSIGVALAPQHGREFNFLFRAADITLYRAKQQGKNCCLLYDDKCPEGFLTSASRDFPTAVSARIDSDEKKTGSQQSLASRIFRLLYGDELPEKSIPGILSVIGKQFRVSRAYIFEISEDGRYLSNTFEWCDTGVEPQIKRLQKFSVSEDLGKSYIQAFNQEGVFYCRDISSLPRVRYESLARQGVCSVLQCEILENGKFRGIVGFDDCRDHRYWNQEQIDALFFVSEIVGTFLLNQRAKERAERAAQEMCVLLESQSSWVYVIRQGSYEMLYINRKTLDLDPNVRVGMRCHKAFFKSGTPCAKCPARVVEQGKPSCTMHIYNPYYRVWSSADARRICWRDEDAILLTCHDITDLMPPIDREK